MSDPNSVSFLSMLKPFVGSVLERALNRAVALDPQTAARLYELEGRTIAFKLRSPPIEMQITVENNRLKVSKLDQNDAQEHDLEIDSSIGGLLKQAPIFRDASAKSSMHGRLRISGDADLAREVQNLMANFEPDYQLPFVNIFGDVLGVQMAKASKGAFDHAKQAGMAFAENSALYVTEETRDVLGKQELTQFNDAVDTIRDDVERMAARINQILAARKGGVL